MLEQDLFGIERDDLDARLRRYEDGIGKNLPDIVAKRFERIRRPAAGLEARATGQASREKYNRETSSDT